jgi:hypothetical protein
MTPENVATAGWSVEQFAQFWSAPDPDLVRYVVTEDVVGDWPGDRKPVRGVDAYTERIRQVIDRVPGIRLEVAEHAANGDFVFVRWIAHGTGHGGPFEMSGIDRIRLRDGLVAENIIRYDPQLFDRLVGPRTPRWP